MKNRVIIMGVLAAINAFTLCKGECLLSSQSRSAVVVSGLKGATLAAISYLACSYLWNDFKVKPSLIAGGIWATLGGVIHSSWTYAHTPEAYFEYAKRGVIIIQASNLLQLIVVTDALLIVAALKDYFFHEQLPLFTAFSELTTLLNRLQSYEDSLQVVLNSHRDDLYVESEGLLKDISNLKNVIKKAMLPLKEDAHFIAEYNAQALQKMQQAQLMAAQAAESSALAQWLKPSVIITTKCS